MDADQFEQVMRLAYNALITRAAENDRGDPANVVDGLFAIANALDDVAKCISMVGRVLEEKLYG